MLAEQGEGGAKHGNTLESPPFSNPLPVHAFLSTPRFRPLWLPNPTKRPSVENLLGTQYD